MATAAGLATLLMVTQAGAQTTFQDPEADQRNTEDLVAPDITSVQVSNTRDGVVTFRVTIGDHGTLPPASAIVLLFDTDREFGTGDQGFEYAVSHLVDESSQASIVLERWDASIFRLVAIPATAITSNFEAGVFTVSVPRGALGNTIGFDFGLYAARFDLDGDDHAVDDAPNTDLWTYDLSGLPAPRLSTQRLVVTPGRPVAGRTFTVGALVRRSDTGGAVGAATVTCTARVGKARVRAIAAFSGGQARCVVSIPRNATGKALRGTLTVRAAGARLSRPFSYRVR